MRIYRIGDERHTLWDGMGAAMVGGRWTSPGRPVIYGSLSYAGAMLEILAHTSIGRVPTTHRYVVAEVPEDITVERHGQDSLPLGWSAESTSAARSVGDRWLNEARSAILLVPSMVAGYEWNALVNPTHPEAARLKASAAEKVIWDRRLLARPTGAS